MPINYIPNDPAASDPATRTTAPAKQRGSAEVRFVADPLPAEALYAPGTRQFVAWQSRESAFKTLDTYESICGPLKGWQGSAARKTLKLIPNAGVDINAYYDRRSISFFEAPVGGKTVYSGASSDVVAHEAGHAILDATRPDLFGVNMMEVAAFHEGFGDCIAIMFALSDRPTRTALLKGGQTLRRANFVEATAEDLSNAIKTAVGPKHNAAAPRRANNSFVWAFPQTLPVNGPPGTLINEAHSLGQLVSGVYYDLIFELFGAGARTEARLWSSCQRGTQLLVRAALGAPVRPRFFEEWGRAMLVVDRSDFRGANEAAIRSAFTRHGIQIGASGFLAPQMSVVAAGRRRGAKGAAISAGIKEKVRAVLNLASGAPLSVRQLEFGDRKVAEVAGDEAIDLTGLSERLAGVTTHVPRPTLVGEVQGGMAILGPIQSSMLYANEVRDFVATLVRREAIAFGGDTPSTKGRRSRTSRPAKKPSAKSKAGAGYLAREGVVTHVVTERHGERSLERVAFACGCRRC